MHPTSRTIRPVIAIIGSLLLTVGLAGCTLVTTLAGGGRETITPTPTKSETTTPGTTNGSPKPTTASPKPTNSTTSPTSGETVTSDRAQVEKALADDYEQRFGVAATVTCDGGTQIEFYEGMQFDCNARETGGSTHTLEVVVTAVNVTTGDVTFNYTRV